MITARLIYESLWRLCLARSHSLRAFVNELCYYISAPLTAIPSRDSLSYEDYLKVNCCSFVCRAWSATSLWCDRRLSVSLSLSERRIATASIGLRLSLCDLRVWLKGLSNWKPLQLRYFRALLLSLSEWSSSTIDSSLVYDRFPFRLR